MLIAENKDLKTLQERLGHVDAAMTLNVYGHLIKELQAKARNEDGGILGQVLSRKKGKTGWRVARLQRSRLRLHHHDRHH